MLQHSPTIAAILLAAVAGSAAAQMPRDPSAAQNVQQSRQYEQALRANPGFRAQRIEKECGPITDPQLREQCLASFGEADAPPPRPATHR